MNLLEEIKKYLIYLNELGINFIPATQNLNKFLKNSNYLPENSLENLKNKILNCQKCPLHRIRKQPIWGEGNEKAKLLILSDYPTKDEDFYGKPFVGEIGEIFNKILLSIGLKKEDFFITYAVKCKTPGGRLPEDEEISACKTYLLKQIKLIQPKLILSFGFTPPKAFFENSPSFSSLRGKPIKLKNSIILFTYHPHYILKNPAVKRLVWEDLQQFRKLYEEIFKT